MYKYGKISDTTERNSESDSIGSGRSEEQEEENFKKPEEIKTKVNTIKPSFNIKAALDCAFSDLKNSLKDEAKISDLAKLANDVVKETDNHEIHEQELEKFDCGVGNNFRTTLTVNDETEKNNLACLLSKDEEEEKALLELCKHC